MNTTNIIIHTNIAIIKILFLFIELIAFCNFYYKPMTIVYVNYYFYNYSYERLFI